MKKTVIKKYFPISVKDAITSVLIILLTTLLCFWLRLYGNNDIYVTMPYILGVFFISRFTTGYLYGIIASFVNVIAVNYFFAFPYFKLNFSLPGYPLIMLSMLVISIITGTLTTQIKEQNKLKLEAEKEKMRGNLLRAISHDLRTPLTSILGSSSAIIENDERLTCEARINLVKEINEDAQWLIRMVENLLSITRINGEDKTKVIKQYEAAEEVVAAAVLKFRKKFPDVKITVRVPDDLLIVPMDVMLIEQVLINLLENVVYHAENFSYINLLVTKVSDYALFEVIDDGKGLSDDRIENIFSSSFNIERDKGDSVKNMGIGLSVCNTIIKAHGGNMKAANIKNGGADIQFRLPLEVNKNNE